MIGHAGSLAIWFRLVCGSIFVVVVDGASRFQSFNPAHTFSPVVAVLTQPEFKAPTDQPQRSYLPASYVSWLESRGARVVPLHFDAPKAETLDLLSRVNGVVFPGGAWDIVGWDSPRLRAYLFDFSPMVFDIAVQNKIPMWGTCLGMLQFMWYTSGQPYPGPVTAGWDAAGPLLLPVNLTADGRKWSPIASLPANLFDDVQRQPWAWHSHEWSVGMREFDSSSKLVAFWDVLASDADRRGVSFVSLAKAKELPIFISMFHPEKVATEFQRPCESINGSLPVHSADAIDTMARLGEFFVQQCRGFRDFGFTRDELLKISIHNWQPTHSAHLPSMPFDQMYFFPARGAPALPPITGNPEPTLSWGQRLRGGTTQAART